MSCEVDEQEVLHPSDPVATHCKHGNAGTNSEDAAEAPGLFFEWFSKYVACFVKSKSCNNRANKPCMSFESTSFCTSLAHAMFAIDTFGF